MIADLGVNFVEKQVLLCGYTAERVIFDYGYDLLLRIFNSDGEPEDGEIPIQIKASDVPQVLKNNDVISIDISRSDIILWLGAHMPVILIVYDAGADSAYWLYVQRYFGSLPDFNIFTTRKTMAVHIPKSNILDSSAIKLFTGFRDRINKQLQGRIDHNA